MVHQEPTPVSIDSLAANGFRFTLFEEPRFTVEGEIKPTGELFIHAHPFRVWNKSTYKAALEAMNIIKDQAARNGFDVIYGLCRMHKLKLTSMFGFKHINTLVNDKGEPWVLVKQETR